MLSHEQFQQPQFYQPSFDLESTSMESYPPTTMEYRDYTSTAYNNNFAFAFADVQDMQSMDASIDNFKFEMARSLSDNSMTQQSHEYPPALLSSGSIGSTSSSTVGSPYSGHAAMVPVGEFYHISQPCLSQPTIFCDDSLPQDYSSVHDLTFPDQDNKSIVPHASLDPNLLSGSREFAFNPHPYNNSSLYAQPSYSGYNSSAPSPVPSQHSYTGFSQNVTVTDYQRGASVSSHRSSGSPASSSGDEERTAKGICADCGRVIKDMKAHILTHSNERPHKCPIPTCDFYKKGFARKYDKDRHTLTHYKGTMICGFCPGSGSSAEKSFNRADVFKRHMTTVHGVEPNPPNSRKRSQANPAKNLSNYCQDATGKCSTCSATFSNAQTFYDHLDDCVLRVVQQEEPSEKINALRLAEVESDLAVQATMDRNFDYIPVKREDSNEDSDDEDDDVEEDDDDEDDEDDGSENSNGKRCKGLVKGTKTSGNVSKKFKSSKRGMAWSKIGVPLAGKGRKRRKHYPPSWGMTPDKMKMRKRVILAYDGSRRLLKDDMMLDSAYEVRLPIPNTNHYITDLDVESMKRAEAYHNATEEEKGEPWIEAQDFFTDLMS